MPDRTRADDEAEKVRLELEELRERRRQQRSAQVLGIIVVAFLILMWLILRQT